MAEAAMATCRDRHGVPEPPFWTAIKVIRPAARIVPIGPLCAGRPGPVRVAGLVA
jgi:hypothetical protein